MAATISAIRPVLPAGLVGEERLPLVGEGARVALERRAGAGALGRAEEHAKELGDVVLVHAEVHEPARILGPDGLHLLAREAELTGHPVEIAHQATAQGRIAPQREHHLVGRQGLVAALDVTHDRRPSRAWGSP
jgi:hypothetical protein